MFEKDVSYVDFVSRAGNEDDDHQPKLARPWLNLFVPKSQISDFNYGVLIDIVLKRNITTGLALFYPMNRNK
jgi:cytokinin dehydrogenase